MSESIFPNAKPKLLGAGEDSVGIIVTPAVAGLSGSLTVNDAIISATEKQSPTPENISSEGVTRDVESIVSTGATSTLNKVTIIAEVQARRLGPGTDPTFQIREGTTVLGSVSIDDSDTLRTINVFLNNISVGNHTYTSRIVFNGKAYAFGQFGGSGSSSKVPPSITVVVTNYDDTHAGFIQSVAIAGKQINTPDSHTTHEQAVLPG